MLRHEVHIGGKIPSFGEASVCYNSVSQDAITDIQIVSSTNTFPKKLKIFLWHQTWVILSFQILFAILYKISPFFIFLRFLPCMSYKALSSSLITCGVVSPLVPSLGKSAAENIHFPLS